MKILVVNSGSSSLKLRLVELDRARYAVLADGAVERIGPGAILVFSQAGLAPVRREVSIVDWHAALQQLLRVLGDAGCSSIVAVGHRVVNGGRFSQPVVIDDAVVEAIEGARRLAPLHNGPALEGIRAARHLLPGTPMVAVFDTAFHAAMPHVATQYALPDELTTGFGLKRYGYHGIAHRSMTERYGEIAGVRPDDIAIITLQLGNGCSAAAVRGLGSIDTSMGFTPAEGLVMGTRSGDLDPAAVTYLQREHRMSPDEIDAMLNHKSGLIGLSGTTGDMGALLEQERRGDPRARAAIELFCYRARKYIGAYLAVLGKTQAVVFGGGIGERAPEIRRRICEPLAPLGLIVDNARNAAVVGCEGRFDEAGSPIAAWVIPSDEQRIIAQDTYEILAR